MLGPQRDEFAIRQAQQAIPNRYDIITPLQFMDLGGEEGPGLLNRVAGIRPVAVFQKEPRQAQALVVGDAVEIGAKLGNLGLDERIELCRDLETVWVRSPDPVLADIKDRLLSVEEHPILDPFGEEFGQPGIVLVIRRQNADPCGRLWHRLRRSPAT